MRYALPLISALFQRRPPSVDTSTLRFSDRVHPHVSTSTRTPGSRLGWTAELSPPTTRFATTRSIRRNLRCPSSGSRSRQQQDDSPERRCDAAQSLVHTRHRWRAGVDRVVAAGCPAAATSEQTRAVPTGRATGTICPARRIRRSVISIASDVSSSLAFPSEAVPAHVRVVDSPNRRIGNLPCQMRAIGFVADSRLSAPDRTDAPSCHRESCGCGSRNNPCARARRDIRIPGRIEVPEVSTG
jgi:hypothetical protein